MPIFFTKKSCNRGVEPPPQMPPLTVKASQQTDAEVEEYVTCID